MTCRCSTFSKTPTSSLFHNLKDHLHDRFCTAFCSKKSLFWPVKTHQSLVPFQGFRQTNLPRKKRTAKSDLRVNEPWKWSLVSTSAKNSQNPLSREIYILNFGGKSRYENEALRNATIFLRLITKIGTLKINCL